jgi:hypothetical protein
VPTFRLGKRLLAWFVLVSGGESSLRVIGLILFIQLMIAGYIFSTLHQNVRNQNLAGNVSYPLSLEALDCAVGSDFGLKILFLRRLSS